MNIKRLLNNRFSLCLWDKNINWNWYWNWFYNIGLLSFGWMNLKIREKIIIFILVFLGYCNKFISIVIIVGMDVYERNLNI